MTSDRRGEFDALRDDLLVVLHQAAEVRDALDEPGLRRAEETFEVLHLAIVATAARVRAASGHEVDSSDPAVIVAHALRSWGQSPHARSLPPGTCRVTMPASVLRQILEDVNRHARARRFPLVLSIDAHGGARARVVITASEAPSCTRLDLPDPTHLDWLCLATDVIAAHGGAMSRFVDPESGARRTTVALPTVVIPNVVVAG